MAFMIIPSHERSTEIGIAHLAHVPVIWSAQWQLIEEASEYLIARSQGQWSPRNLESSTYSHQYKPAENSIVSYGRDLENFLTYCERRRLDWRKLDYQALLEFYQEDMQTGRAAKEKAPLAPSTINRRVGTVCDFLGFAASTGRRGGFAVSYSSYFEKSKSSQNGKNHRRVGRVRRRPDDLRLPSRQEIKNWLEGVRDSHRGPVGITAYLMCRMAIETGMRAEEIIMLRADEIPDPFSATEVRPGKQSLSLEIMHGTKGGRKAGDKEKIGKKRRIRISRNWLARLHDYKRITRQIALQKFRERQRNDGLPRELFLSPVTGQRYSYDRFREFWIQRGLRQTTLPYADWTPHCGRHAWACYRLLDLFDSEFAKLRIETGTIAPEQVPRVSFVNSIGQSLISTEIKPFMGHVSQETTELYLRWVAGAFGSDQYVRDWSNFLDGSEA